MGGKLRHAGLYIPGLHLPCIFLLLQVKQTGALRHVVIFSVLHEEGSSFELVLHRRQPIAPAFWSTSWLHEDFRRTWVSMADRNHFVCSREDSLADWKIEGSDPDFIIERLRPPICIYPLSKPPPKSGRPFNIEFCQNGLQHLTNCIETYPKFRLTVASAKRAGQAVREHPRFRNDPEVRALKLSYRWSQNILKIIQNDVASEKGPGDDEPYEITYTDSSTSLNVLSLGLYNNDPHP